MLTTQQTRSLEIDRRIDRSSNGKLCAIINASSPTPCRSAFSQQTPSPSKLREIEESEMVYEKPELLTRTVQRLSAASRDTIATRQAIA
jgi:hypothetical protein